MGNNKVAKENLNKNSGRAHKLVLSFTFLFPYKNLPLHNFHIRAEGQQTEIILERASEPNRNYRQVKLIWAVFVLVFPFFKILYC